MCYEYQEIMQIILVFEAEYYDSITCHRTFILF